MILGLTGSFCAGKSTVAKWLHEQGAVIIDADRIAREVVEPGKPALQELVQLVGEDVLREDGTLDRAAVRERIFREPELRKKIENILHPVIRREELRLLKEYENEPLVVLMAPLFMEKNMQTLTHRVLLVTCEEPEIKRRARARDGLSSEEVDLRLQAQMSQEEKKQRADIIIDNSGSPEQTKQQLEKIIEQFRREDKLGKNHERTK